jgi:hypothetical protein
MLTAVSPVPSRAGTVDAQDLMSTPQTSLTELTPALPALLSEKAVGWLHTLGDPGGDLNQHPQW